MPTSVRKLGRKKSYRDLMTRNLVTSILLFERVVTTEAKAKMVRGEVERVLGLAVLAHTSKQLATRRALFAQVADPKAAKKALDYWAPKFADRSAGYLRLTRLPVRLGDGAPMMQIEIIGAAPFAVTQAALTTVEVPEEGKVTVREPKLKAKKTKEDHADK